MRKSRFTDEQVVGIIREADRDAVGEVAKRHGISEQTIYTWRKRFSVSCGRRMFGGCGNWRARTPG
jgi:transposase-like protein